MSNTKLPDDWKNFKLGNVSLECAMGPFGSNIKAENFQEKGVPVIRGQNLNFYRFVEGEFVYLSEEKADTLKKSNCYPGDLVFTHRGSIGQVGLIAENKYKRYVVSQSGMKLTVNPSLANALFLLYFFKSNIGQYELLKNESQVGVPAISSPLSSLKDININLPPITEQKAIAEVLSNFDDKIDLLHKQNQTLEDLAQTLFREWFIEKSDDGWAIGKLPDEFDFLMGTSPKGNTFNEEKIGTPMFQGNADFTFRFPESRVYTTDPKRFANKYETLISVRAPVGAQNMAQEKCCIGRGLAAFMYRNDERFYTYTYYKMMSLMEEIKAFNNSGTVFGSINKNDIQNINITIPPKTIVESFESMAKPINDKIIQNTKQIKTLEQNRDILLPKLMSGELRVAYD